METLTPRQEICARQFALTGKAEQSAIAAGTNPAAARTRAYRWLQEAEIQERIWDLRAAAFRELRQKITQELYAAILDGLESGCYKRGRRAISLASRLGLFSGPQSKGHGPVKTHSRL